MLLQKKGEEVKSKDIAKDRLKNMLMREKTKINKETLDMIKADMISVVSEYASVEKRACDVSLRKVKGKTGKENSVLVMMIALKDG